MDGAESGKIVSVVPAKAGIRKEKIKTKKEKTFYVYLLASGKNGTIYAGVTDNLTGRIARHKKKIIQESFTAKYKVDKLIYCEIFSGIGRALYREKRLKNRKRDRKAALIENQNQGRKDLFDDLITG